ncbi:MAG: hypothetical protein JNK48_09095 [Bryobacterales bacterium]|nr:hypothetical protein [Bryobacterales bacterium]
MKIFDARDLVKDAAMGLMATKGELRLPDLQIEDMADFLGRATKTGLKRAERLTILEQATLVLEGFYAHLPFKRARYAVDPVQRLRLLAAEMDELTDLEFHGELVKTFLRLRDPHTFYALPAPFSEAIAFLPFRMQHYLEGGKPRFLVTNVMTGFEHESFRVHTLVTHYNGMPVEEAVWRETGLEAAGNEDAQFIRGLNSLFGRALVNTAPREEHWAVLQYTAPGASEELGILLPWMVMTGLRASAQGGPRGSIFSSQLQTEECRKALWNQDQLHLEKEADAKYRPGKQASRVAAPVKRRVMKQQNETSLPKHFSFTASAFDALDTAGGVSPESLRDGMRPDGNYGYLRIHNFNVKSEDTQEFLDEAKRILDKLNLAAGDGLVLDVRSNPGGNIQAAERLLQMLTPAEIEPAQFHFMNSRQTREIAAQLIKVSRADRSAAEQEFDDWKGGLLASLAEGSVLTPGRPLTDKAFANDTGQVYQGPVVLLVDALSYSATDIFAAGFEDNKIGPVLGVDRNTGGGGANRWLHEELLTNTVGLRNMGLEKLPGGANLGVAIRRVTRVGQNLGSALEDVGVQCGKDMVHDRTLRDLLEGDSDLLLRACGLLSARPTYWLKIFKVEVLKTVVKVEAQAIGIDRVECYLDGYPQFTIAVDRDLQEEARNRMMGTGFVATIGMDALQRRPTRLKLKGYTFVDDVDNSETRLVAAQDFLIEEKEE